MASKTFLKAQWKNLIMANYIVDPSVLAKYLPYKTEIDTYNGNVYVSLVGFLFSETSMLGFRIPFHINFEEVNLRFYVRYNDNGTWKRGVVFIKEIVPKPAITFVANTVYRENYCTMPMKHEWKETNDALSFKYQWKHKSNWNSLHAMTEKIALPMLENSEAHFIAEHYWGYSKYNEKTTFEYEVQHEPWKVFPVKDYGIDCDFEGLYGNEFSFLKDLKPESVFVAEGSGVAVLNKRRIF
ncbi:MAG: DUF2071 domain-containing protein [Ferruginibacter sp.]